MKGGANCFFLSSVSYFNIFSCFLNSKIVFFLFRKEVTLIFL